MAVKFKRGDTVRLNLPQPRGPVVQTRLNEQDEVEYLVEWTDADGNVQQRWFPESMLDAG